jgi:hypothetical protein
MRDNFVVCISLSRGKITNHLIFNFQYQITHIIFIPIFHLFIYLCLKRCLKMSKYILIILVDLCSFFLFWNYRIYDLLDIFWINCLHHSVPLCFRKHNRYTYNMSVSLFIISDGVRTKWSP